MSIRPSCYLAAGQDLDVIFMNVGATGSTISSYHDVMLGISYEVTSCFHEELRNFEARLKVVPCFRQFSNIFLIPAYVTVTKPGFWSLHT